MGLARPPIPELPVTLPILDRDESLSSIAGSARAWRELVGRIEDPQAIAIGHWTARDVVVHVCHLYELFAQLVAGGKSPIRDHLTIGEEWDALVKADPQQDLGAAADRAVEAADAFIRAATADVWEEEVWWHGDLRVPVYSLAGFLVNEAEVHSFDVARSQDDDWELSRSKAVEGIVGLLPVLPYFVYAEQAKELRAVYELRVRSGPTVYITVRDGVLSIDATPAPADCKLSVDPVEYVLVGFGRRSQWVPIATGKIVAWGKKPWLSLKFSKLFHAQ